MLEFLFLKGQSSTKFTFMDDAKKEPMLRALTRMMVMDWRMDVLMLSEIPKDKGIRRVRHFCQLLNDAMAGQCWVVTVDASIFLFYRFKGV